KSVLSLVAVLIAIVVLSSSLYIVDERQVAIKLQFGEIVESDIGPGIHFKMPFVQNIRKFDARILTLDSRPERFLTVGKKFLIVDSFVKWQIEDVSAYYKATAGNRWQATTLLSNSTNKGLRDEFASRSLTEVVSGERDELMSDITTKLNEQTLAEFGIRVLDVRVKGI
ncbi:protease modulator HflC, partial [Oleiphilus sp. HI0067]